MRAGSASRRCNASLGGHGCESREADDDFRILYRGDGGSSSGNSDSSALVVSTMSRTESHRGAIRKHSELPAPVVEHVYSAMHAPVLVLNASYEPINVCAARRAIVLVLKGVAMTEEINGHFMHSTRLAMRVPSVIRLLEYRRIPHQTRALSRKNILLCVCFSCFFCFVVLGSSELTLDHVIPRSRHGASTWENLVACCHDCNRKKGNMLPHECGMRPQREPRPFNLHTSRHLMRMMGRSDAKWR